jgi:hypothetical protein
MALSLATFAHAQVGSPNTIAAKFIPLPFNIDGRLDESEWQEAIPISNFTQRELEEGAAATVRTLVAIF